MSHGTWSIHVNTTKPTPKRLIVKDKKHHDENAAIARIRIVVEQRLSKSMSVHDEFYGLTPMLIRVAWAM